MAETCDKGHGRLEWRRLQTTTRLAGETDWPDLAQVCRITRRRVINGCETAETAFAVTSVPREQADAATLLRWWRGHWRIENSLHWVRDQTFGEDACRVRTGAAGQALAALRNTVIGILRGLGTKNLAAAVRRFTFRPDEIFTTLGILE